MSTSTNTKYGSNSKINISTEATTIHALTLPIVNKFVLETSIQAMIDLYKKNWQKTNNLTNNLKKWLI